MSLPRDRLIAALDVGSSKVCCLIGRLGNDGLVHVRGTGKKMSQGLRNGAVADRDATERALKATVDQAERVAGETIEDVIVSISTGELRSLISEREIALGDHPVREDDVDRALTAAAEAQPDDPDTTIHAFPAAYSLDGRYSVKPPLAMYGDQLGVALHTVKAPAGPAKNLATCVRGAHLNFNRFVAAPYASGLSTLIEDERIIGTACIDIGAGTTDISIWAQGAMVHVDVIPFGGEDLTAAIARELVTSMDHAERLKTKYGTAMADLCGDGETVIVDRLGPDAEDAANGKNGEDADRSIRIPRRMLAGILVPELEVLFEQVRERLRASGFDGVAGRRVVLTGGTAQLLGIDSLAQAILDKDVRLGQPRRIADLAASAHKPDFATAAGLLLHALEAPADLTDATLRARKTPAQGGGVGAMWRWVKEHF